MSIDTGAIYDQILALKIDLDFGDVPTPAYLQEKILECSDAMRSIEKRIIEVTRELSSREKDLKLEQMRLEVKRRSLLVNDPGIKKLPTGKEREAAADETLQADHEHILTLDNDVNEMRNLLSGVRLVHQNLKTTNSDIRVLMRIMEQQVYKLNIGSKDDKEMKDLVAGLGEVEQLEDELTPDDVESSSMSVEDEQDGRSKDAPPNEAGTASDEAGSEPSDELDVLTSFLAEDPEENGGQTTAPGSDGEGEEEDEGSAQSAVGGGDAKTQNGAPEPTEAAGDGGGGTLVTELDIDLGDIDLESPAVPAAPPDQGKRSDGVKGEKKESVSKDEIPLEKTAPKKDVEVELDIDDILTSLD
jgi:hypothetical protein